MKARKRFILQSLLWAVVWILLGSKQGYSPTFLVSSSILFLSQLVLIAVILYFLVPIILYKKEYILFGIISITIVLLLAYISVTISPCFYIQEKTRQIGAPIAVYPFLIHLLFLFISLILATVFEVFIHNNKKKST